MKQEDEQQPFAWNSCILKIAFVQHCIAFLLSGLAFFSPFWYVELNTGIKAGLWGRCDVDLECIWFQEQDYAWERSLPSWYVASQVLFAIGIGILFISLCLAIGNMIFGCCKCKVFIKETCPFIFGILILVAIMFQTFSIGTYGVGAYHVYECSIHSWVCRFEWAFAVGITSLFICLFASLTYLYVAYSIREDYKGYDPFTIQH